MNKWDESHRHPCLDCSQLCSVRATRCRKCSAIHSWKNPEKRAKFAKYRGENSPFWKGGRGINNKGYVSIYVPGHPRARPSGHVQEHIVVWEKANKQTLPDGWVIHHLNGVKGDNRPVNLVALPDRKHRHVMAAKAKRIQELEALLNNQHQLL